MQQNSDFVDRVVISSLRPDFWCVKIADLWSWKDIVTLMTNFMKCCISFGE